MDSLYDLLNLIMKQLCWSILAAGYDELWMVGEKDAVLCWNIMC